MKSSLLAYYREDIKSMKNVFDICIFQSVIIVTGKIRAIPNIKVRASNKEVLVLFNAPLRVRELNAEKKRSRLGERESAVAA